MNGYQNGSKKPHFNVNRKYCLKKLNPWDSHYVCLGMIQNIIEKIIIVYKTTSGPDDFTMTGCHEV